MEHLCRKIKSESVQDISKENETCGQLLATQRTHEYTHGTLGWLLRKTCGVEIRGECKMEEWGGGLPHLPPVEL